MLFDLLRGVEGTVGRAVKASIKRIDKKYIEKLTASSMIIKIIGFSAIMTVTSVHSQIPKSQGIWNSELQLNTQSDMPVTLPDKSVAIKVEPKVQKNVQLASVTRRSVTARERVAPASFTKTPSGNRRALAQAAAAKYNVPWQIVEAVWQVESGKSWDTTRGSYAGARGPMQFMPGTWRAYGVDANGDGRKSVYSAHDSVYAGARYLAANGANRGRVRNALYRYNHSTSYVNKVLRIARSIGYRG